jgi:hypothetical protein
MDRSCVLGCWLLPRCGLLYSRLRPLQLHRLLCQSVSLKHYDFQCYLNISPQPNSTNVQTYVTISTIIFTLLSKKRWFWLVYCFANLSESQICLSKQPHALQKYKSYSVTEFWKRMVASPIFLSILCPAQSTFSPACDNTTSGHAVKFLNVSVVLWKHKPSLPIGKLSM